MKKYLSSILSLILALAMVFSLVACGSDDSSSDDDDDDNSKSSSSQSSSDESGTSSDAEVSDEVSTESSKPDKKPVTTTKSIVGTWEGGISGDMDGIKVSDLGITVTFEEDGTMVREMDLDDSINLFTRFLIAEGGEDYTFDDLLEDSGLTEDELYDYIKAMAEESHISEGTYEFDGETLIIDGEVTEFEYDGDVFTVYGDGGQVIELERA